jgi:CDP-paratose 2-epimerase
MKYILIGGAGFIGSNFAERLLEDSQHVTILDDLSRKGAASNLRRLRARYPRLEFIRADIRKDREAISKVVEGADVVFHLAAQVGVTSSVADPRLDFEINALGTLNILECIRALSARPILLYASTNKVYGALESMQIVEDAQGYSFLDREGISESDPIDLHSPYGCSKGAGECYVRDYARVYGLRTVVLRQSCIYGPGQFGTEDQGWVAWFAIAAMLGVPITMYGDGKQTRDVLFVDDLFKAWMAAVERIDTVRGECINLGGGSENTISLSELVQHLSDEYGYKISVRYDNWRPGDQRIYVSDITKARNLLGWTPKVSPVQGIQQLLGWIIPREPLFRELFQELLSVQAGGKDIRTANSCSL